MPFRIKGIVVNIMSKILLGSMSPGRKHVLNKFGFQFDCFSPEVNEKSITDNISLQKAIDLVLFNSKLKMDKTLEQNNIEDYSLIITSDTTVFYNYKIFEKTNDKNKARNILYELAGKWHIVITGFSLYYKDNNGFDQRINDIATTEVKITADKSLIDFYLLSDDCLGKAGCYGVQGSGTIVIDEIKGSIDNVIGLPLSKIFKLVNSKLLNLLKTTIN